MPLTALCSDANGTPRPATGPWTIGAYAVAGSSGTHTPPQPPTGLKVVVN
jgi:hypothetical protein